MSEFKRLPSLAYVVAPNKSGENPQIRIVIDGEWGYYVATAETNSIVAGLTTQQAWDRCHIANARVGISMEDALRMAEKSGLGRIK